MYDFSKSIAKFHADHVRLTNAQRADMKRRRGTILGLIEKGLEELDKPAVAETINQGGYAQKTMTQPPENDLESRYDIDLGVVFEEADASGPRTTRNWIRDAIACKASKMKNGPETKKKCVRVVYADGYQCDFPVFRRRWTDVGWKYELSAGDDWEASNPAAMNKWIEMVVSAKSPETSGSYQLRRIIRMGKFYSKTHASRLNRKFPGGLVATALFVEAYVSYESRDDIAFRETLRRIASRSKYDPVYANGVKVSDAKDTDRIGRLIEQAKSSVKMLDGRDADCTTDGEARKAWKNVFCHSFFNEVAKNAANDTFSPLEKKSLPSAGLAAPMIASEAAAALSTSERSARMEEAVNSRRENGGGGKPWSN